MGRPLVPSVNRFVTAPDGLRLHMREYGSPLDPGIPVVCLPGLSRCSSDFARLAGTLATGSAGGVRRRVLAFDYRGRGASDHDPDWRNFELGVEQADIFAMLTAAGIADAIFIGTSRGGLHIMAMAAFRPNLLRGAILNDVGPVIEPLGLIRIRRLLCDVRPPRSLEESIALIKGMLGKQFTNLSEEEWEMHARATFQKEDGTFGLKYCPMLVKALESLDLDSPLPTLWPLFDAMKHLPLLIIRGANSDILSRETFDEMARRHAGCDTLVVPGQGHAPLLYDDASIDKISKFIAKIEGLPEVRPSHTAKLALAAVH